MATILSLLRDKSTYATTWRETRWLSRKITSVQIFYSVRGTEMFVVFCVQSMLPKWRKMNLIYWLGIFCSLSRRGSGDSDYFWPRGQMAEAATTSEQPLRHGDVHQQAQKSETHSQVLVQLAATSRMSLVQHIWRHTPVKRYELLVLCLHSADFTSTPPTAPPWKWTSPCCRSHSPTPLAWFWHMVKDEKKKKLL